MRFRRCGCGFHMLSRSLSRVSFGAAGRASFDEEHKNLELFFFLLFSSRKRETQTNWGCSLTRFIFPLRYYFPPSGGRRVHITRRGRPFHDKKKKWERERRNSQPRRRMKLLARFQANLFSLLSLYMRAPRAFALHLRVVVLSSFIKPHRTQATSSISHSPYRCFDINHSFGSFLGIFIWISSFFFRGRLVEDDL